MTVHDVHRALLPACRYPLTRWALLVALVAALVCARLQGLL